GGVRGRKFLNQRNFLLLDYNIGNIECVAFPIFLFSLSIPIKKNWRSLLCYIFAIFSDMDAPDGHKCGSDGDFNQQSKKSLQADY
ncbi:MAG: hypothetical protein ACLU7V_05470, partial [Anaerovoracaceae bacterium]